MYCPKCKSEYIEGYTICPTCEVPLVETFPYVKEVIEAINPILLKSVSSEVEAEIIMELLRNNSIACFRKSKGIGSYMNVYMGYSIYGEDIYVDKRDYERAKTLLQDVLSMNESESIELPREDFEGFNEEQPEERRVSYLYEKRQIIARIIIVLMIGGVLLSFIMNYLF